MSFSANDNIYQPPGYVNDVLQRLAVGVGLYPLATQGELPGVRFGDASRDGYAVAHLAVDLDHQGYFSSAASSSSQVGNNCW